MPSFYTFENSQPRTVPYFAATFSMVPVPKWLHLCLYCTTNIQPYNVVVSRSLFVKDVHISRFFILPIVVYRAGSEMGHVSNFDVASWSLIEYHTVAKVVC